MAKADLQAAIDRLSLTAEYQFIPWSQSRHKGEKHASLNWKVRLLTGKQEVLTCDYMSGAAHCPASKWTPARHGPAVRQDAIRWECEHGREARCYVSMNGFSGGGPILPDLADILYCLVQESDVLEYRGFEDWASTFGYDTDSRKAESTYRECLENALKLRGTLGDSGVASLRQACEDY